MIYWLLFWEFFKIGLFAIGGGLVTVPFLFDLSAEYGWFDTKELADMIAVSQSTPGPVGINMATYAGFNAAGIGGALVATLSEVLPSVLVIYGIARLLHKMKDSHYIKKLLSGIRPAVLALILTAGWSIAKVSVTDYKCGGMLIFFVLAMHFYKRSAIFYIILAAAAGVVLRI